MSASNLFWTAFLILSYINAAHSRGFLSKQFSRATGHVLKNGVDPGEPLFLTPLIEKGDIITAQKLAQVGTINGTNLTSYAGFLTVDKRYNSNLFFWYFPLQEVANAPLLLWLQGGPGGSSLFGLFVENGPFFVDADLNLHKRKFAWTSHYSVVYIDNPVGTGFSFTNEDEGYSRNESDVANNLYSALSQFFTLFPELSKVDFYITGESYAGKYIPSLAYLIHQESSPKKIYLRGIAIGDGWSDPETMIPCYGDYLYQIGLIDELERKYFKSEADKIIYFISIKDWTSAFQVMDALLDGDLTGYPSFFYNVTGMSNYYNFLQAKPPSDYDHFNKYLEIPDVRRSIHVGKLPFNNGTIVEQHLMSDVLQSVKLWLAEVMNFYKVLVYSGQLDIIVAAPLTEAMLQTVNWQYADEYQCAKKTVWKVRPDDSEVAGYVRKVHDFYQIIVRNGGHILPYDQPEATLDMLDRFIYNKPF